MGASLTALLGYDVTDPRSPHSVHVAGEADVPAVDPWSRATLYRAVRLADDAGAVVVLDHDRGRLYLASSERLDYRPPGTLGLGHPPALVVDEPALLRPDGDDLVVEPFEPGALDGPPPDWHHGPTGTPDSAGADTPATETDDVGTGAGADTRSDAGESVGRGADTDTNTDTGEPDTPGSDADPVADGAGEETPEDEHVGGSSVTVSPRFDVLVPAFDIEERGEPATPLERHAVESPTGAGAGSGTPSG